MSGPAREGRAPEPRTDPGIDQVASAASLPCRHQPSDPRTVLDERARRASHEELAVGLVFVGEGHSVRTLAEGRRQGRVSDFEVCGWRVEVKSFLEAKERSGRAPNPQTVANQILRAQGQGQLVVVWAAESGLQRRVAVAGFELFREQAALSGWRGVCGVRLLGEGFDVTFSSARLWAAARPYSRVDGYPPGVVERPSPFRHNPRTGSAVHSGQQLPPAPRLPLRPSARPVRSDGRRVAKGPGL